MDETIYNRNLTRGQQPLPKSRLLRLVGVEQWRSRHLRQTFLQALMRPLIAISKLPVLLCTVYYFLNFAWIIGVNTTISIWLTTFYKFTPYNLGIFVHHDTTLPIVGYYLLTSSQAFSTSPLSSVPYLVQSWVTGSMILSATTTCADTPATSSQKLA